MNTKAAVALPIESASLVTKMATRFSVEPNKLMATLKTTAFKVKGGEATNEQMMALLIVADQYNLNPFTKEIYAFPDKYGGIVPVVGVDGWSRIINESRDFDGMEFENELTPDGSLRSITCTMHRKDRSHPTKVTELLAECKRATDPWASHPSRMLRHKAMIQCARLAFGFVGIYDEDEAQRIIEGETIRLADSPAVAAINASVTAPQYAEIADAIAKATDKDGVDAARALMHEALPGDQLDELSALAAQRYVDIKLMAPEKA